jgi:hypothetical protein
VDSEHPLWDDIYETKSVLTDAEGRNADDRDKIKFDKFRTRYLALHQEIILNLHVNRWKQTFSEAALTGSAVPLPPTRKESSS